MKQAQDRQPTLRLLGYTLSSVMVVTLYVLIPLVILVRAFFSGQSLAVWAVLGAVVLGEWVVFRVLTRTTSGQAASGTLPQRRAASRRQAAFEVDLGMPRTDTVVLEHPLHGHAVNASADGLAVLVEPAHWRQPKDAIWLQAHLPNGTVGGKARLVAASDITVEGRPQRMLHLQLLEMGHADEARYVQALDRLPSVHEVTQTYREPFPRAAAPKPKLALPSVGWPRWKAPSWLRLERLAMAWPLLLILVLQSIASLTLHNTAYQDEALYVYSGRQLFTFLLGGPAPAESYVNAFSGSAYIYPMLAGAIDAIGGLGAVRFFSLFWMLCATSSVYALTRLVFNRSSALLSATLFAVQGSVLFLGYYATYDAMCLAFVAISAVLALRAGAAQRPWWAVAIGPMLGLVVLTKYVGLMFVPSLLALLVWQTYMRWGWRQTVLRSGLALSTLLVGAGVELWLVGPELAFGILSENINRFILSPDSRLHLARRVFALGGVLLSLGAIGVARSGRRHVVLSLILFGSALLPVAYHIYEAEYVSLHKHVAMGFVFAAPLAGYALSQLGERRRLVSLVFCLIVLSMGGEAAHKLYDEWPNTTALMQTLRKQELPSHAHVLSEPMYESRYYLQDKVDWQWTSLWSFGYTDPAGNKLEGTDAYKAAIAAGYFDMVVLGYGPNRDTATTAHAIDADLQTATLYELIAKVPYRSQYGTGDYWIWRKRELNNAAQTGQNNQLPAPVPSSLPASLPAVVATATAEATVATAIPTATPTASLSSTPTAMPSGVPSNSPAASVMPMPSPAPATASAVPTAPLEVLVNESFDAPTGGWPNRTTATNNATYHDGRYQLTLNGQPALSISSALPATNYRLSADVTVAQGQAGILFLSKEPDTFYRLLITPNGKYTIQAQQTGTVTTIVDETPSAALQNAADAPQRLRIERQGATVSFFANAQLLTTFTVPSSSVVNQYGFALASPTGQGQATFDNLVIEKLPE